NVVLADEINRTPPKTQSALLEAMQERNVTASGKTYELPNPFFVLATQNPIEQEGTYPLPEAQLDRFMFNIWVDYPSYDEELEIVKKTTSDVKEKPDVVLTSDQIIAYQDLIRRIPVADNVLEYAVNLVNSTRINNEKAPEITKKYITWGAGPRASQYLIVGAKCYAAIQGKYSPDIEDVKAIAKPILRHRLVRNYRAEAEGYSMDRIISELL
ncbi:MAG: AAA family ATPase, partial [Crocinitomicaceae bacterium]